MSETPTATGEAWLRLPRFYVGAVADVLIAQGVGVQGWWAGARDPRDATVRLADTSALVWDEECGWRLGTFVSGDEGAHTVLDDVLYLGGGVLPRTALVAGLLADGRARAGSSSAWRPAYRSYRHYGDGIDVALAQYGRHDALVTA